MNNKTDEIIKNNEYNEQKENKVIDYSVNLHNSRESRNSLMFTFRNKNEEKEEIIKDILYKAYISGIIEVDYEFREEEETEEEEL